MNALKFSCQLIIYNIRRWECKLVSVHEHVVPCCPLARLLGRREQKKRLEVVTTVATELNFPQSRSCSRLIMVERYSQLQVGTWLAAIATGGLNEEVAACLGSLDCDIFRLYALNSRHSPSSTRVGDENTCNFRGNEKFMVPLSKDIWTRRLISGFRMQSSTIPRLLE